MTKKIRSFLESKKYNFIELNLETTGDYSPRDSEWNYSDVLHFPHVHKSFDQLILDINEYTNTSFFLQKTKFMILPNIIYQEHKEQNFHEYVATTLSVVISIITEHSTRNNNALVKTNYRFYYNNFFQKIIAYTAKYFTKKNYKTVIDEDEPLRRQRGKLRKSNKLIFLQDYKKIIGPTDTININENNVLFKKNFKYSKEFEKDRCNSDFEISEVFLNFFIQNDQLSIMPTICPHEGADLKKCNNTSSCPWHGRKVKELLNIKFDQKFDNKYTFKHMGLDFELIFRLTLDKISINIKST